jgi:hypothetical protein
MQQLMRVRDVAAVVVDGLVAHSIAHGGRTSRGHRARAVVDVREMPQG